MSKQVRVRFAPSPTGALHIGGVRTALFNYLFAKKNNGVFYLRIEDTDQNRYVEGAEKYILDALDWLGIAPDETINKNEKFGPYRQSERKAIYKEYANTLIESGQAYYAFDTSESLDFHRKQHEEQGKTFIYNWHNREKLDTSLVISKEELRTNFWDKNPSYRPFVINLLYAHSLPTPKPTLNDLNKLKIIPDLMNIPRGLIKITTDQLNSLLKLAFKK